MTRRYGWKAVRPDGRTRGDFAWPLTVGAVVHDVTTGVAVEPHDDPCPAAPGDGLCVGLTARGCASAGFSSPTLLIVSWDEADTAAETVDKVRVQGPVTVEAVLDWWRLLREGAGVAANLRGANLRGANLRDADLRGANLRGWERGPDGFARLRTEVTR